MNYNFFNRLIDMEHKIFASKGHLKRYWPLNNRIMAYKNSIKNLKDKNMDPK